MCQDHELGSDSQGNLRILFGTNNLPQRSGPRNQPPLRLASEIRPHQNSLKDRVFWKLIFPNAWRIQPTPRTKLSEEGLQPEECPEPGRVSVGLQGLLLQLGMIELGMIMNPSLLLFSCVYTGMLEKHTTRLWGSEGDIWSFCKYEIAWCS